jgi:hypothetical protein
MAWLRKLFSLSHNSRKRREKVSEKEKVEEWLLLSTAASPKNVALDDPDIPRLQLESVIQVNNRVVVELVAKKGKRTRRPDDKGRVRMHHRSLRPNVHRDAHPCKVPIQSKM